MDSNLLNRARGAWIGMMVGDALGCPYEFSSPQLIAKIPNDELMQMRPCSEINHVSGQITDDSEMAIALAVSILDSKSYSQKQAFHEYQKWYHSRPIDCGIATAAALNGLDDTDFESQANGALMRIAPLGIYAAGFADAKVAEEFAEMDAFLTHPNEICVQVNRIFASLLRKAIKDAPSLEELYAHLNKTALENSADETIMRRIVLAKNETPKDYFAQMGWVLTAFQNAIWQMLHSDSFEDAILNTIRRGGDTDTNAAICGTLMGAIYGEKLIPKDWIKSILYSKSKRPEKYHPRNCTDIPAQLLALNL